MAYCPHPVSEMAARFGGRGEDCARGARSGAARTRRGGNGGSSTPGDPIRGKRWCSSSAGEGLECYRHTGGNSKIPPRGSYRRGAHSISGERSSRDAPPDHAVPAPPSWRVSAVESAWTCYQGRSRVFPYSGGQERAATRLVPTALPLSLTAIQKPAVAGSAL